MKENKPKTVWSNKVQVSQENHQSFNPNKTYFSRNHSTPVKQFQIEQISLIHNHSTNDFHSESEKTKQRRK